MEDKVGKETLETISAADNFNKWMYDTIKPFSKGKVLEIGSGIGNISSQFLNDKFEIMLSDYNTSYCEELRIQYSDDPNTLGVQQIDLVDPDFDKKFVHLFQQFDTVFALNVIEHIKDDNRAIANCSKFLKPEGHLIILVPSYQKLYNTFDRQLGHYRRYTTSKMSEIFKKNSLETIHRQYFNSAGILGWFLNGNVLKKKNLPVGQMKIFNSLVPVFKVVDSGFRNKIGLSTIVVGKKTI